MKEGIFLRRMHPVLTPKLYFRISMIFYTALSTSARTRTYIIKTLIPITFKDEVYCLMFYRGLISFNYIPKSCHGF